MIFLGFRTTPGAPPRRPDSLGKTFAKSLVKGPFVIPFETLLRRRRAEFIVRIAKAHDGPGLPARENSFPIAQRAKSERE